MRKEEIICDHCGARKGASNHWWSLKIAIDVATLVPWGVGIVGFQDLCGMDCVWKELSIFADKQIGATTHAR